MDRLRHLSCSYPLGEDVYPGQGKARDQEKVGDGNEDAHQRGSPGHSEPFHCPPDALRPVESGDRRNTGCGVVAVTRQEERFAAGPGHKLPKKETPTERRRHAEKKERATGFEPATSSLGS